MIARHHRPTYFSLKKYVGRSCRAIRSDVKKLVYFVKESLSVSKVPAIWICSFQTGSHVAGPINDSDRLHGVEWQGIYVAYCRKLVNYVGLVCAPLKTLFLLPEAVASSYFPLRNPSIWHSWNQFQSAARTGTEWRNFKAHSWNLSVTWQRPSWHGKVLFLWRPIWSPDIFFERKICRVIM